MVKNRVGLCAVVSLLGITAATTYVLSRDDHVPVIDSVVQKIETLTLYCPQFPNEIQYDTFFQGACKKHDLEWLFQKAILIKESHFQEDLISTTGAVGPMQLMPRDGSYITDNYSSYVKARESKGRSYKGKKAEEWVALYRRDLEMLVENGEKDKDKRFDPECNINEGVRQLAEEHDFFLRETDNPYYAKIFAAAAYNSGRTVVLRGIMHIPVNKLFLDGSVKPLNMCIVIGCSYARVAMPHLCHAGKMGSKLRSAIRLNTGNGEAPRSLHTPQEVDTCMSTRPYIASSECGT